MRLASCGVKCLNSSSVFQINFSAGLTVLCPEIPHERQAQKRWLPYMTQRLILIFLIFATSCQTKNEGDGWHTLDFGSFTIKAPKSWTIYKEKGTDSYVGSLTTGLETLSFDLGEYSQELDDYDILNSIYAKDTINGLEAFIQIPKNKQFGDVFLSIPKINSTTKFSLRGGLETTPIDTVLKMFKTITFKQSDTNINPKLTISKFNYQPKKSGKSIFMMNCASCHGINKLLVGPSFEEIFQTRNDNWIFQYVTNRKAVSDSKKNNKNEVKCLEFPKMTKEEFDKLIEYAHK
jgi:cytochrome c551/c552